MVKPVLFVSLALSSASFAQQPSIPSGTYNGVLSGHQVLLHFTDTGGKLACTADNPDQNMTSMPCASPVLKGQSLSFSVPAVRGSWTGFVSADGNLLMGTWS